MIRVRAGISYALTEAMDEGHELVELAEKLLEVPQGLVLTAVKLELADGTVVSDSVGETDCVFLAGLYRSERGIADRLLRIAKGKVPWPWIDLDKALPWVEQRSGLQLAETQKELIRPALASKVLVITGGPGPLPSPRYNSDCSPISRAKRDIFLMRMIGCRGRKPVSDYADK